MTRHHTIPHDGQARLYRECDICGDHADPRDVDHCDLCGRRTCRACRGQGETAMAWVCAECAPGELPRARDATQTATMTREPLALDANGH